MINLDIHLRNVVGIGAKNFCKLLLDSLGEGKVAVENVHTCESNIDLVSTSYVKKFSKKYSYGFISRIIEIFFWKYFTDSAGENDILVLGDLPLNTNRKQYILLHQSMIFEKFNFLIFSSYKFLLFRFIYILFFKENDTIIVQTDLMKQNIVNLFSNRKINVSVLSISSLFENKDAYLRTGRKILSKENNEYIKLFYPSAFYPHKNHHLLYKLDVLLKKNNIIIYCTIEPPHNYSRNVRCLGSIPFHEVECFYKDIDCLLFLSSFESLGMPLYECIQRNIPIICPDLEYTKNFRSENCIYFNINNIETLIKGIEYLVVRLEDGWWPSWPDLKEFDSLDSVDLLSILNKVI